MKIKTNNRLAHYQVELGELREQTYALQATCGHLEQEIGVLNNYLLSNNGDSHSRTLLRCKMKEFRSLQSKINRNIRRMNTLTRQISIEGMKIQRGR